MILTCPNCNTRYLTTPEAIGENGRTVRCSKCSNTWFVAAEPDALALEEQMKPELIEMSTSGRRGDGKKSKGVDAEGRRQDDQSDETFVEKGAHVSFRDNVDKKRRNRRLFGVAMIWVTTLGLLILAALLAFFFRQPIVEKFPQTSAIYEAFSVKASVTGLILEAPQHEYVRVEGEPRLVVNGTVQNLTKKNKDIPLVKLSILNRNDEEITHWFVQPTPPKVGPRGKVVFAAEYPNPPVDAASLTYKFADEGE